MQLSHVKFMALSELLIGTGFFADNGSVEEKIVMVIAIRDTLAFFSLASIEASLIVLRGVVLRLKRHSD